MKENKNELIIRYFEEIETNEEYNGYMYNVADIVAIVTLGSLCGLKNISQIHQWAESEKISEYLKENYAIERIPCYFWMLTLMKMVKPESLEKCIRKWAASALPSEQSEERKKVTIAVDGKTIRSTEKMKSYKNPIHIISAQLSEAGITYASRKVDGKTNEIPEVQSLLKELDIAGCMIVADALNCQKETAKAVIESSGDYLLSVKGNQPTLQTEIKEYVEDKELLAGMDTETQTEKNRDRLETRTSYVTRDMEGMSTMKEWEHISCFGAIHKITKQNDVENSEWHYYISSRNLTAEELLYHARMEWTVETMHWLLDVHYREDYLRVVNETIQENMNMLHKFAISLIKAYKEKTKVKRPMSQIMLACLLDTNLLDLLLISQN